MKRVRGKLHRIKVAAKSKRHVRAVRNQKCGKCGGALQKGLCLICPMLADQAPPGGTCTMWPMESMSLAEHPDDVQAANEKLAAAGIGSREAYYKLNGKLVLESAAARKKVMKTKKVFHGGKEKTAQDLSAFI